jgi:hypothetical protein
MIPGRFFVVIGIFYGVPGGYANSRELENSSKLIEEV